AARIYLPLLFCSSLSPPPRSSLFPYTTLFRSGLLPAVRCLPEAPIGGVQEVGHRIDREDPGDGARRPWHERQSGEEQSRDPRAHAVGAGDELTERAVEAAPVGAFGEVAGRRVALVAYERRAQRRRDAVPREGHRDAVRREPEERQVRPTEPRHRRPGPLATRAQGRDGGST